jgi:hemerythrin
VFSDRIDAFQRDVTEGKPVFYIDLLVFLRDWWMQHIATVDKKYVPYLATHEPSADPPQA